MLSRFKPVRTDRYFRAGRVCMPGCSEAKAGACFLPSLSLRSFLWPHKRSEGGSEEGCVQILLSITCVAVHPDCYRDGIDRSQKTVKVYLNLIASRCALCPPTSSAVADYVGRRPKHSEG
jgi:hypothetical protein